MEAAAGNQAFPQPGLRPQDRQGQACTVVLRPPGTGHWGFSATASLIGCFLAGKLGWEEPGLQNLALWEVENLSICPQASARATGLPLEQVIPCPKFPGDSHGSLLF